MWSSRPITSRGLGRAAHFPFARRLLVGRRSSLPFTMDFGPLARNYSCAASALWKIRAPRETDSDIISLHRLVTALAYVKAQHHRCSSLHREDKHVTIAAAAAKKWAAAEWTKKRFCDRRDSLNIRSMHKQRLRVDIFARSQIKFKLKCLCALRFWGASLRFRKQIVFEAPLQIITEKYQNCHSMRQDRVLGPAPAP